MTSQTTSITSSAAAAAAREEVSDWTILGNLPAALSEIEDLEMLGDFDKAAKIACKLPDHRAHDKAQILSRISEAQARKGNIGGATQTANAIPQVREYCKNKALCIILALNNQFDEAIQIAQNHEDYQADVIKILIEKSQFDKALEIADKLDDRTTERLRITSKKDEALYQIIYGLAKNDKFEKAIEIAMKTNDGMKNLLYTFLYNGLNDISNHINYLISRCGCRSRRSE